MFSFARRFLCYFTSRETLCVFTKTANKGESNKMKKREKKFQRTKKLEIFYIRIRFGFEINLEQRNVHTRHLRHEFSPTPIDTRRVYRKILHNFRENKGKSPKKIITSEQASFFSCSSGAVESKLTQVWEEKLAHSELYVCTLYDGANSVEKKNSDRKTSLNHMAYEIIVKTSLNSLIPPRAPVVGLEKNCIASHQHILSFHLRFTCVERLFARVWLIIQLFMFATVLKVNKLSFRASFLRHDSRHFALQL